MNITEFFKNGKKWTTLSKGVAASGLDLFLRGRGPFTVFAPSDSAFGKLESGTFENLLKPENKTELTSLLNKHVIAGRIKFQNLKDGEKLKTLNGEEVLVRVKDSKVSINGSVIQTHDVQTSNGVIHSLSTVLKN